MKMFNRKQFKMVRLEVGSPMLTYSFVDLGSDSLYEHLYKCIKNDIMNGKSPRLDTLEQLAAGLKVKISDLYDSPYK